MIGAYVRVVSMVLAFAISIPICFFTHLAYACWAVIPLLMRIGVVFVERRLPKSPPKSLPKR